MADIFLLNGRPLEHITASVQHGRPLAAEYGRQPRFGVSAFVICRDIEREA